MRRAMAGVVAGLCLSAIASEPAQAQTVRAYALVETAADGDSGAVFEALRSAASV